MNEGLLYLLLFGVLSILILIFYFSFRKNTKLENKTKKLEKLPYPNKFKCMDGHSVRSKGELIIDNLLYVWGLKHVYEKRIVTISDVFVPDWYLPDYNLFIEYWGFSGNRYEIRKRKKINFYKNAKLKVISVENHMFNDIYSNLGNILKTYIDKKKS